MFKQPKFRTYEWVNNRRRMAERVERVSAVVGAFACVEWAVANEFIPDDPSPYQTLMNGVMEGSVGVFAVSYAVAATAGRYRRYVMRQSPARHKETSTWKHVGLVVIDPIRQLFGHDVRDGNDESRAVVEPTFDANLGVKQMGQFGGDV